MLNTGGPVEMPWKDKVSAIVEGWFLGGEVGNAEANVLTGRTNPSGKLPVTFPKRIEDNPTFATFPGKNLEAHYSEDLLVGYRWYDNKAIEPLFPFGYGLTYTRFSYANLKIEGGAGLTVGFDVTNTGKRAGADVPQVYVEAKSAAGTRA